MSLKYDKLNDSFQLNSTSRMLNYTVGMLYNIILTVHLYGDLLSENFQAMTTVDLVAHFTVKFFGTSVECTNARRRKTERGCIISEWTIFTSERKGNK